jgi:hypothetical protein
MTTTYEVYLNADQQHDSHPRARAVITITCDMIAGAEQNLVLLDDDGHPIATLTLQPGFDRRQTSSYTPPPPTHHTH